eukprot:751276-Hanusia_phi.AAC.2
MASEKFEEAFQMMRNLHSSGVCEFSGVPVEENERQDAVVYEMRKTMLRLVQGDELNDMRLQ